MSEATHEPNNQLILICGESGSGKSASLRNLENQEDWLYGNTEAGKRPPFRNKFKNNGGYRIEEYTQVYELFDYATNDASVRGVIVDSLTFMMDMVESQLVLTAGDTQKAWGQFQQFFKILMQDKVTKLNKPCIFTAHVRTDLDEGKMEFKTAVPIKGALKGNGVEAYFSTVVSAKKVPLKVLEKYGCSKLLTITDEEKELGFKHVFQTRITKETTGERIRSPMGMFSKEQTYIDNDAQLLLNHLNEYYGVKSK